MKKLLARYFPVMQSHPERVSDWEQCKKLKPHQRYSAAGFDVIDCTMRAPIPEVSGCRILFVSDWHWHNSARNFRQLQSLEKCAAEISPDVLVLGGDMVEDADVIDTLPEVLARLRKLAPECIAVMGNWETGKRWLKKEFWQQLYADAGITLLCNQSKICGAVRFHGIEDISSGNCFLPEKDDPAISRPGSAPLAEVIIAHSPDTIVALDENMALYHYDAALCGHNHGGQIRLPLLGALFCPSRYGKTFAKGCFIRKNSRFKMFVSAGIGEKRRSFRLFCPPEVALLTFRQARHYRHRKSSEVQE